METTSFAEIKELFILSEERWKKTEKERAERDKKNDLEFKKLEALFTTQWGKLMETLVEGDLIDLLNQRGIPVYDTSKRRKGCRNGENYEFDIIAHNGIEVVIVEVKTTLRVEDVKDFEAKMKRVKILLPDMANNKVYGAVAFLTAEGGSEIMAEKLGLFIIKATGKSASINNAPNFEATVF